jgi:hypothetical protein
VYGPTACDYAKHRPGRGLDDDALGTEEAEHTNAYVAGHRACSKERQRG